jgi:hypothetical protein
VSIDEGQEVVSDHNLIVLDQEALFVDAAARDVHLKPGSEAIDAGSDLAAPAMDIEGVSRPQGGGIDIGAYEFLEPGTVERGQAPLRAGSGVARVWMVPFGGQREIAVEVAAGTRLASSPRLRLIDRRGRRVAIISLSPATPRRWRGVLPEHGNLATGRYLIRVPTDEGCIRGSLVLLR